MEQDVFISRAKQEFWVPLIFLLSVLGDSWIFLLGYRNSVSCRMEDEVGELAVAGVPACGQSLVFSICPALLLLLEGFN